MSSELAGKSQEQMEERITLEMLPIVRKKVQAELQPSLDRTVAAIKARSENARTMMDKACKINDAARAGFERQAQTAAAVAADRKSAAEDREAAEKARAEYEETIKMLQQELADIRSWA